MTDVIIDIETLSTKNNACVLTIGALKFYRRNNNQLSLDLLKSSKSTFYVRIDKNSCDKLNLHVDDNTLEWWNKQSKEARFEVFDNKEDRINIKDALLLLKFFCGNCKFFWSQGSFDYNILTELYNILDIEPPWKYYQIRDSRTLFDVCSVDIKKLYPDDYHNALSDCYRQYLGTFDCLQKLKDL